MKTQTKGPPDPAIRQRGTYWGVGSTTQRQAHHLIRKLWIDPAYDYTQQQLADIFRVSVSTINQIVTYRSRI